MTLGFGSTYGFEPWEFYGPPSAVRVKVASAVLTVALKPA